MKVIILVESSPENFEEILNSVDSKELYIVNTEQCDEDHEYLYLLDSIRVFDQSKNEIMLTKFSGRERIIRELGDERSEMILALSSNKKSKYYSPSLVETFSNIIQTFEKGDYINLKHKK